MTLFYKLYKTCISALSVRLGCPSLDESAAPGERAPPSALVVLAFAVEAERKEALSVCKTLSAAEVVAVAAKVKAAVATYEDPAAAHGPAHTEAVLVRAWRALLHTVAAELTDAGEASRVGCEHSLQLYGCHVEGQNTWIGEATDTSVAQRKRSLLYQPRLVLAKRAPYSDVYFVRPFAGLQFRR